MYKIFIWRSGRLRILGRMILIWNRKTFCERSKESQVLSAFGTFAILSNAEVWIEILIRREAEVQSVVDYVMLYEYMIWLLNMCIYWDFFFDMKMNFFGLFNVEDFNCKLFEWVNIFYLIEMRSFIDGLWVDE